MYYSMVIGNRGEKSEKQECVKDCSFIFINIKARIAAPENMKKKMEIYCPVVSINAFYFFVYNLSGS